MNLPALSQLDTELNKGWDILSHASKFQSQGFENTPGLLGIPENSKKSQIFQKNERLFNSHAWGVV